MAPIDQTTYSTLTVTEAAPKVSFFGPPDGGRDGGGPNGGSMGAADVTPNPQN